MGCILRSPPHIQTAHEQPMDRSRTTRETARGHQNLDRYPMQNSQWTARGQPVDSLQISTDSPRTAYQQPMNSSRTAHVQSADSPWTVCEEHTDSMRRAHGQPADSPWRAHGQLADRMFYLSPCTCHGQKYWRAVCRHSIDSPWTANGQPADNPWTAHQPTDNPWTTLFYEPGHFSKEKPSDSP